MKGLVYVRHVVIPHLYSNGIILFSIFYLFRLRKKTSEMLNTSFKVKVQNLVLMMYDVAAVSICNA